MMQGKCVELFVVRAHDSRDISPAPLSIHLFSRLLILHFLPPGQMFGKSANGVLQSQKGQ